MSSHSSPADSFDRYDEYRLHMEKLLSAPLFDFDLSPRILIPLDNKGIRRLGDLVKLSRKQLLGLERMGVVSVDALERILDSLGLSFRQ